MATNSILRDIQITDKKRIRAFIIALEDAKNKNCKKVKNSKNVKQLVWCIIDI